MIIEHWSAFASTLSSSCFWRLAFIVALIDFSYLISPAFKGRFQAKFNSFEVVIDRRDDKSE